MNDFLFRFRKNIKGGNAGMELVQVAILIAIAVFLGIIFKSQIGRFVNQVFGDLMNAGF